MRIFFFLLSFFCFFPSKGQVKFNLSLKNELDSIYELHNASNLALSKEVQMKADSIMKVNQLKSPAELLIYLNELQKQYDSSNIQRIKAIINQYGYPGKSLVDSPTNKVTFYILQRYLNQHPNEFPEFIPLLKASAETNEIPFSLYAIILDRSLLEQGKEQIYGTQTKAVDYPLGNSGIRGIKWIVWPIKDAATVNERRKTIGISETVEEMAQKLNFTYHVYTLEDIRRLQHN